VIGTQKVLGTTRGKAARAAPALAKKKSLGLNGAGTETSGVPETNMLMAVEYVG